ncbi:uncharacterized protein BDR25DRAFT_353393 [Lindgomyces ingoldianus]|uniref:Uncharacterized protein n=1 Tax=Lindgomyces ingoldianus TaxID=673940 RepID=A0ACB6R1Z3_9PLEO|nr:uncharacterized protein BDR25DRAFT_353393 [Lindgomyces ingoldianus]KAF2472357.1 hypothetical protein BDR25DRAFT_353393 [Lindgomyces ingoldianus]
MPPQKPNNSHTSSNFKKGSTDQLSHYGQAHSSLEGRLQNSCQAVGNMSQLLLLQFTVQFRLDLKDVGRVYAQLVHGTVQLERHNNLIHLPSLIGYEAFKIMRKDGKKHKAATCANYHADSGIVLVMVVVLSAAVCKDRLHFAITTTKVRIINQRVIHMQNTATMAENFTQVRVYVKSNGLEGWHVLGFHGTSSVYLLG